MYIGGNPGTARSRSFIESRSPRKNRDKFINTTVRVMVSYYFIFLKVKIDLLTSIYLQNFPMLIVNVGSLKLK